MYEIWDFTRPTFKSYMSFETINTNNLNRMLYVINLESKNSIRMGIGDWGLGVWAKAPKPKTQTPKKKIL